MFMVGITSNMTANWKNWKKISTWFGDHPAFISTNGARSSPPIACELRCENCTPVLEYWADFRGMNNITTRPMLDLLEDMIKANASVICNEFLFEAEVKNTRTFCNAGVVVTNSHGKKVLMDRDDFFQPSDLTYGSWSFMYGLDDWSRLFFGKDYTRVTTGRGASPAAPAYLIKVFSDYDSGVDTSSEVLLKSKLVQCQRIADLFVKALYGYDDLASVYRVTPDSAIGQMFPRVDKNFIQGFKKAWIESRMMTAYAAFRGGGVTKAVDELWAVTVPPMFKSMRESADVKRATYQIQNPVSVNEKTFRGVVSDMLRVVFGSDGCGPWDAVEIPYKKSHTKDQKEMHSKRFSTALCLLQLGIGSRSRGIIAINKIEQFDTPVLSGLSLMKSLDHRMALRVTNLTKDKTTDAKAYKKYKQMTEFDNDYMMSDAVDLVDRTIETIDKPVQYYLFDPVSYYESVGIGVCREKLYAGEEHHPREVFMQLFKTCRDYIHSKYPSLVAWEQYHTGGRDIWMVSQNDRLSANMNKLYRQVYPLMLTSCETYLSTHGLGMTSFGTHELRRLYVCYSFEFFGRGKTKEIAYAQYVLHHTSLSSTVFYTTLQFDMFLGHGSSEHIKVHEKMLSTLASVERQVNTLKRKLLDVGEMGNRNSRRVGDQHVEFKTVLGGLALVRRLPHASHGATRDELVERGVVKGNEMLLMGVSTSKNALRKAGVNSSIVVDVFNKLAVFF
jgi:hypothetical protein